jgi:uncharacterized CHY-type Zn-finger protein
MSSSPTAKTIVHGLALSPLTQCSHYFSPLDIIAIKHACCNKFYACISCHNALEHHVPQIWPKSQRQEDAVFCGACQRTMTVDQYLQSGSVCPLPGCGENFNPKCKGHRGLYFEVDDNVNSREDPK